MANTSAFEGLRAMVLRARTTDHGVVDGDSGGLPLHTHCKRYWFVLHVAHCD
jgi:hypothetical protein